MPEDVPSWADEQRSEPRRRRLRVGLGIAVLAGLVLLLTPILRSRSGEDATPTPGFTEAERSIDTEPFSPAGAENASGATTIPGGPLGADGLPIEATTTSTTSTTLPIPDAPPGDPICGMATVVVEALRIVTGPNGTTPDNLAATAAKFEEAADTAARSTAADTGPLVELLRAIAADLPSATDFESAAQIYNRLLAPTDPAIAPVAAAFGTHLTQECPSILSIEP